MQRVINQLQSCQNFKESLRNVCRANRISITLLNGLTIKRLRVIYARTLQQYHQQQISYETNPLKAQNSWFENQLRLFHWGLILESFFSKRLLTEFGKTSEQWEQISSYFPPKSLNIFQFEAKKLIGHSLDNYSRSWAPEECELLSIIMEYLCEHYRDKTMINQWNEVARRFYEESGKRFYRSSKQCRQQWFNHLDNSKRQYILNQLSGGWTPSEDKSILEFVLHHGRRWAKMCKEFLPHRTEHMIKNRFKSLLSKAQPLAKKDQLHQRRLVRRVLANIETKEQRDRQSHLSSPKKNGDVDLIKKQPTVSTDKELGSRECLQDSFLREQPEKLSKNGRCQVQDRKQIINLKVEQQNKQSVRREPVIPSSLPVPQNILPNPSFNSWNEGNNLVQHQYLNPSDPVLPFISFCPYWFFSQSFPSQTSSFGEGYPC